MTVRVRARVRVRVRVTVRVRVRVRVRVGVAVGHAGAQIFSPSRNGTPDVSLSVSASPNPPHGGLHPP